MQLRIFAEPQQGATYQELSTLAQHAEAVGFDGFFRSDHYLAMGDGEPRPGLTDAWTTLAGLTRDTSTITLGTLVTSSTFRLPGPLAVTVAQVDQMSGGRVELGIGAGWFQPEHDAFGIPFPSVGDRFDRLEDQLAIITGIWASDGTFSHHGKQFSVTDAPATVRPARPVPIIIGGSGKTRTPALAARYAAEFNVAFGNVADSESRFKRVAAASDRPLINSVAQTVCVGRDETEVARRAAAIGQDPDELRKNGLAGTPSQVVDRIGEFAAIGAERIYLQVLDVTDLDQLDLIASEVASQV